MALKNPFQFPFLSPSKPLSSGPNHRHRFPAEVRFSRWNNANAQKFIRRQKTQQELEDQLRFQKRFDSAQSIVFNNNYSPAPPHPTFKSTGTPSSPSRPSIPGKKSKYSKDPNFTHHPAFIKPVFNKTRKIPILTKKLIPDENAEENNELQQGSNITPDIQIDDRGVSYQFPDAPFVYQYSYTETPKVQPLGIREPLVAPFETATMERPWTGRKPLPPSKKKLPEFDSFKLPPPHKKGVKPVQSPGPYLPGSGPKYVQSREEILGEPLTKEEIDALVESCRKSTRQLNIGRDGLTHNMLDNIHALWKRKRLCKIKCKGVCTVDMDNVRQQLEEKTGGQVIYSRGGVIFLFRGRNYNHKYRPRYPLMLWKPVPPVYPRLIKRAPEGLTLDQATELRKKGRKLKPICKLGKNGVYVYLVKDVREAFEECELVRIDCQGMNGSDYRKIGAKLKELVPCVLVSFEEEHILVWRGRNWKSSLPELTTDGEGVEEYKHSSVSSGLTLEDQGQALTASASRVENTPENHSLMISTLGREEESVESIQHGEEFDGELPSSTDSLPTLMDVSDSEEALLHVNNVESIKHGEEFDGDLKSSTDCLPPLMDVSDSEEATLHVNNDLGANNLKATTIDGKEELDGLFPCKSDETNWSPEFESDPKSFFLGSDNHSEHASSTLSNLQDTSEDTVSMNNIWSTMSPSTEGVLLLRKQAVESGSAVVLDEKSLDADLVYQKAVDLWKSAPSGPVYRHGPKKLEIQDTKQPDDLKVVVKEAEKSSKEKEISELRVPKSLAPTMDGGASRRGVKKSSKRRSMKDIREDYLNIAPRGTLQVDELAKLLS